MNHERKQNILRTGALAAMVTLAGLGTSKPIEAQSSQPLPSSSIEQGAQTLPLTENPLLSNQGLTLELFLNMGGQIADRFNSGVGNQTEYSGAPTDGTDGIFPTLSTDFVSYSLSSAPILDTQDFTWKKISTDLSENEGMYMSLQNTDSEKFNDIAIPGTFGAATIFQDGDVVEYYMEFQVPNLNLSIGSEADYEEALRSILNVPDEISSSTIQVYFGHEENGEYIDDYSQNYFAALFPVQDLASLALLGPDGDVHLVTATVDTISDIINPA